MNITPFQPTGAEPSSIGMDRGYDQVAPEWRRTCCRTTKSEPHSPLCIRNGDFKRCPRCGKPVSTPGLCGRCERLSAKGR